MLLRFLIYCYTVLGSEAHRRTGHAVEHFLRADSYEKEETLHRSLEENAKFVGVATIVLMVLLACACIFLKSILLQGGSQEHLSSPKDDGFLTAQDLTSTQERATNPTATPDAVNAAAVNARPTDPETCGTRGRGSDSSLDSFVEEDEMEHPRSGPGSATQFVADQLVHIQIDEENLGVKLKGEPPGIVEVEHVEEGSLCSRQGVSVGDRLVMAGTERLEDLEGMTSETFRKILQSRPLHLRFQKRTPNPVRLESGSSLGGAARMLAGLGKWARKAKQTAAAEMARTEAELRQVQDKVNEDWEDGVPEPEKRVFPRPNFARYKWTLRTCFEHDWKFIRPRFLKDLKVSEEELKEVEECLKEKYMWVMPLYRKLSSEETNEGGSCLENISQFGVSRRSVLRILGSPPEGINILDKVTFTQAKATELYKQTNFVRPEETANFLVRCDTVLSRHQFAEFLVRAALIKWPDQPKVKAIENLFEELAVLCKKYSGDMRELITSGSSDEVQAVYEAIEPQTWSVFVNMASVHENLYGQKYMTLQDWRNLLNRMNIFVLYPVIKRKYGAYTFRMGLEPQADEQYNKTWQLMSFLEFQRALGAVMFLSEMRTKKECPPTILAALLEKIAKDNLSQIASVKLQKGSTRQSMRT